MKSEGHPTLLPAVFVDVSTNRRFVTRTTTRAKKQEEIDGVEHQLFVCDITSDSHPAYTGEKRFVDTAGRVDKFKRKFSRGRAGS